MDMPGSGKRYFNGVANRITQGEITADFFNYQIEVVPQLWLLTRTSDIRIFQNKSIPEILGQIFTEQGLSFETHFESDYPQLEYMVQYRESDFNFVSRLMEEEGIFYFFRHGDGEHTMVIADSPTALPPVTGQVMVPFWDRNQSPVPECYITNWEHQYQFVSGKWAMTDYDFKAPSKDMLVSITSEIELPGINKYEVYHYPGGYTERSDGLRKATVRMEEDETSHNTASGASYCRNFTPGHKFILTNHPAEAENGEYLITSVLHHVKSELGAPIAYSNSFTAMPTDMPFRPMRVTQKPVVSGVETAVVVGPSGEEIYTDKYGRVKVQFHWDREGKRNENSSCWIRVAHIWGSGGWGQILLPRIGEEVVVEFLEGDPDRPLITGRVYNAETMPPYPINRGARK
jgi:type VI secretion system secreted protein VgrG